MHGDRLVFGHKLAPFVREVPAASPAFEQPVPLYGSSWLPPVTMLWPMVLSTLPSSSKMSGRTEGS